MGILNGQHRGVNYVFMQFGVLLFYKRMNAKYFCENKM